MKRKDKLLIFLAVFSTALIAVFWGNENTVESVIQNPKAETTDVSSVSEIKGPPAHEIAVGHQQNNGDEDGLKQYEIPLADLKPTMEQEKLLFDAEEKSLVQCMNERGHEYHPNEYSYKPYPEAIRHNENAIDYGLVDELYSDAALQEGSASDAVLSSLSTEQQQVWMDALAGAPVDPSNIPEEGPWVKIEVPEGMIVWNTESCLASAARAVYGDDMKKAKNTYMLTDLQNRISSLAEKDPGFLKSQRKWRECMKNEGFAFSSRNEIIEHLYKEFLQNNIEEESFRAKEIKLASIDSACSEKSNLDRAFTISQRRAEAQIRNEFSGEIFAIKADLDLAIKRAERLSSNLEVSIE